MLFSAKIFNPFIDFPRNVSLRIRDRNRETDRGLHILPSTFLNFLVSCKGVQTLQLEQRQDSCCWLVAPCEFNLLSSHHQGDYVLPNSVIMEQGIKPKRHLISSIDSTIVESDD